MNDGGTQFEETSFAEHARVFELIDGFSDGGPATKSMDKALEETRIIFDKYLELPSLLDQHVEPIVSKLATTALSQIRSLQSLEKETFWNSTIPHQLSALYALSKVRGRKKVQRFLSHEVKDVHVILKGLQELDSLLPGETKSSDTTTSGKPQLWESIYILWTWMETLSLVPFDSSVFLETSTIQELMVLNRRYLSEAGPTRNVAASCLASWLSRQEFEKTHLTQFQTWAIETIHSSYENDRKIFIMLGTLQAVVTVLKSARVDRSKLIEFAQPFWPVLLRVGSSNPSNILLRKYLVKFWARAGIVEMPPRVAGWRYNLGNRSLEANLKVNKSETKEPGTVAGKESANQTTSDVAEFFLIPDQVEVAMGEVLCSLQDKSTVVRWSAAKGVGRLTERLPRIGGDDVLDAILELFEDNERENNWHGACLTLAELARRGLLLPNRLDEVIPRVVTAIHVRVQVLVSSL